MSINIRNHFNFFMLMFLLLIFSQNISATEIYQWQDNEGVMHFSDQPQSDNATLVSVEHPQDKTIYRWEDEAGVMQYGQEMPSALTADIHQVQLVDTQRKDVTDNRYSILNQAQRMQEQREKIEQTRLEADRLALEAYQIAQEQETLRVLEMIRKQGYGPRPYRQAYFQSANNFSLIY